MLTVSDSFLAAAVGFFLDYFYIRILGSIFRLTRFNIINISSLFFFWRKIEEKNRDCFCCINCKPTYECFIYVCVYTTRISRE